MASRDTNLNINVTAANRASDELRKVAAETAALEDGVDVPLTADDQASADIDQVQAKATALDGTTADVTVTADDQATRELERVESRSVDLDGRKVTVSVDADDNASRILDRIEQQLRDLDGRTASVRGDASGGAAGGGISGGSVAAGGLAGAIVASVVSADQLAIKTQTVADLTGSTLEDASKLVGTWTQAGFQVEDLLDILLNVNQVIRDNPELAEQLGVKIGENTTLIETFLQAVTGVSTAYDNAGDRAAAASQLFGEEGVRQVGAVQTQVGDLAKAIEEMPVIVDPEDVERAREANRNISEAKTNVVQLQQLLANTILPGVNRAFDNPLEALIPLSRLVGNGGSGPGFDPSLDNFSNRTFGAPDRNALFDQAVGNITNVIFEAPGSPTTTVEASRVYYRRNGVILS